MESPSPDIQKEINDLEASMQENSFWENKEKSQAGLKRLNELKSMVAAGDALNKGPAIMTIFAGAGGDDAEDFAGMLYGMYRKYIEGMGWGISIIHKHENDHNGFRNLTFEITGKSSTGKGAYGELKKESGVHRLVRISPFNAKKLRHTSFALVEVIPLFADNDTHIEIPERELEVTFARSGGPGGQNVNKRETAVRILHIPSNISVHVTSERNQAQNRQKGMEIIRGKLYKMREEERVAREKGMQISKTTSIEWGNQIRSYVLHPYKMVKDHRTDVESHDPDAVLGGDLQMFIDAER